jgi:Uncharacterised nucleotidyltransferase
MSISPGHLGRFSPEFQLTCLCCRVDPTAVEQAEIRRLLGVVDVAAFCELAVTRHRIGSLVHAALCKLPASDLPPGLMAPLAEAAKLNAVKVLQAMRTHIMLARWFAEAGVDWLPFKGITLAVRYYGDSSARHVNDLDIWVPAGSLDRARTTLREHGFRELGAHIHGDLAARGERHAAYLASFYHEEQQYNPEFGNLELHWRLADDPSQFRLAPEQILANADTIKIGSASVRVMSDPDLLLYLCDHGARHGWSRLKWLADLPRVLAHGAWDWPQVLGRARQLGCYQSLVLGLALCRDLFGWSPPAELSTAIARSRRLTLALRLMRHSWDAPAPTNAVPFAQVVRQVLRELALNVLLTSSPRSVLYQLWRYLLSPNDLRVLRLPDRWFGLYYLMRPALILARRASGGHKSTPPTH